METGALAPGAVHLPRPPTCAHTRHFCSPAARAPTRPGPGDGRNSTPGRSTPLAPGGLPSGAQGPGGPHTSHRVTLTQGSTPPRPVHEHPLGEAFLAGRPAGLGHMCGVLGFTLTGPSAACQLGARMRLTSAWCRPPGWASLPPCYRWGHSSSSGWQGPRSHGPQRWQPHRVPCPELPCQGVAGKKAPLISWEDLGQGLRGSEVKDRDRHSALGQIGPLLPPP